MVVDYLIEKNIMSPDSTLENPCVGNEDFNSHWKLLLAFGVEDVGVDNAKGYI